MTGYMKISEAAKRWEISERRVNSLCLQGRIPDAVKFGTTWAIPEDAEKPKDKRVTTGKYMKKA
ncbi:MAG: DNA-binding protein [Lachnospiraceae bacterium]